MADQYCFRSCSNFNLQYLAQILQFRDGQPEQLTVLSSCALSAELSSRSFAKIWSNTVLLTDDLAIAAIDYRLQNTLQ